MEIELLLNDDDRYKLLIARYLELEKNNYLTLNKLYDVIGISKFKVDNFLDQLNEDFLQFTSIPKIFVESNGEITTKNLNLEIIKRLRKKYFNKSTSFILLTESIEGIHSLERFAENNFLSISRVYQKRKQVKNYLKKYNITLKKNKLIGEELNVRSTLFSIYFDIYNGIDFPFSTEIYIKVQKLIRFFEFNFNLKQTSVQKTKLELLIGLILCRTQTKSFISASFITTNDIDSYSVIENYFSFLQFDTDQSHALPEFGYIYLYLLLDNSINNNDNFIIDISIFSEIDCLTNDITKEIFDQIAFLDETMYETQNSIKKNFFDSIKQSNRQHFIYDFMIDSFTSEKQINFFIETYPVFSQSLHNVLNDYKDKLYFSSYITPIRLFYDYIFSLIDYCPLEYIEKPIYVYVDFSHGKTYTNFIISQVKGFKNFNFIVENKISSSTNLYMSDCLIEKLPCTKIIWKNPPTPDDWEDFGNTIVKIKLIQNKN